MVQPLGTVALKLWWNWDLRRKRDVVLERAAVDGQPLVRDESCHFARLNVVHRDAHQVPGWHLTKGAAVDPHPQVVEFTQGSGHGTDESVPSSFLEKLPLRIVETSDKKCIYFFILNLISVHILYQ